jgi:hypothetical protein
MEKRNNCKHGIRTHFWLACLSVRIVTLFSLWMGTSPQIAAVGRDNWM